MNHRGIVQLHSGIPPIIYLQWFGDEKDPQPDPDWNVVVSEVTWSLEPIFDADIEYRVNQPLGFDSPTANNLAGSSPLQEIIAALQMIAGERQCPDNLMSDKDIARSALAKYKADEDNS